MNKNQLKLLNKLKVEDPKTSKWVNIKNTGSFNGDYTYDKNVMKKYNKEQDENLMIRYRGSVSEITTLNDLQMYIEDNGGILHIKFNVFNIKGRSGVANTGVYPTINNNLLYEELVIN
jgi:hypothetical protein